MNNMSPLYPLVIISRQARELEREIYQIHLQKEAKASRARHSRSFKWGRDNSRKLFSKIRLALLYAVLQKDFNLNNK